MWGSQHFSIANQATEPGEWENNEHTPPNLVRNPGGGYPNRAAKWKCICIVISRDIVRVQFNVDKRLVGIRDNGRMFAILGWIGVYVLIYSQ